MKTPDDALEASDLVDALRLEPSEGRVQAFPCVVRAIGAPVRGWFSGRLWAFVEEDASWIDEDGLEMSLSPRWSEGLFLVEAFDRRFALDFRDARLAMAERYRAEYATPAGAPDPVPDLFERGARTAIVREYGLADGESAWLALREERHWLPPARPGAEPRERTRSLTLLALQAADAERANELLTPGYRRWSY